MIEISNFPFSEDTTKRVLMLVYGQKMSKCVPILGGRIRITTNMAKGNNVLRIFSSNYFSFRKSIEHFRCNILISQETTVLPQFKSLINNKDQYFSILINQSLTHDSLFFCLFK